MESIQFQNALEGLFSRSIEMIENRLGYCESHQVFYAKDLCKNCPKCNQERMASL